jgi:glycosyltransferase involved in cell wall biosynthesis
MARYMTMLALNPSLAQKMGEAARQRIGEYFSLDSCINKLWQIIQEHFNDSFLP